MNSYDHDGAVMEEGMMEEQGYFDGPPPVNPEDKVFPEYEDSPTEADLAEWKQLYGPEEIFMVEIGGKPFVYRTLTRAEYKEILRSQEVDPMWREEVTVNKCLLWPKDYRGAALSAGRAGVPTMLAEQIMESSGFSLGGAPRQL